MAEYIERDKLIEALEDQLEEHGNPSPNNQPIAYGSKLGITYGLAVAKTIPAADVINVVRCKGCVYCHEHTKWNGVDYLGCNRLAGLCDGQVVEVREDDFCSYGERNC